jgi:hypothetical protein
MAIDIDGLVVLRAITATPKLFPNAATEVNNFARKYVVGQLKPTTITLERLREIYGAIGGGSFVLILDGQTDSGSTALVKKLDKDNPDIKTAPSDWLRRRIADLASGAAEPVKKSLKTPKKEPAGKSLKTPKEVSAGKRPTLTPEQKEIAAGLKKAISLEKARELWREAGEASFTLVLAGLTEKQTLGLAKRLDKDNPDLTSAPLDLLRERIGRLARGAAEPVLKNILENKALDAVQTRTPKVKKSSAHV